jgi:malonyl-CoA O-methyltransferase
MDIKQSIRRNFARGAASYDRHAEVQRLMARDLLERVQDVAAAARRILEVGCGTGYFTELLHRAYPDAELVALDLDESLIAQARTRLGPESGVHWLVADGEALDRGKFDLLVSNATFQWFTRAGETLQAYGRILSPGGCLAFATLGPGTFRELAVSLSLAATAQGWVRKPEIPAQRFLALADWKKLLGLAGFTLIDSGQQSMEAHFPSAPEFFQALKAMGATNPRPLAFSPRLLQALIRAYDSRFRQNGSVPATYEILWALARK